MWCCLLFGPQNYGGEDEGPICVYALLWVEFEGVYVTEFNWYWCHGGSCEGYVYVGSNFPCVGEFDVVMCGGGTTFTY